MSECDQTLCTAFALLKNFDIPSLFAIISVYFSTLVMMGVGVDGH